MLRPQGYAVISEDAGFIEEADTITCNHCNRVVRVKPGTASTVYILEGLHVDPITKFPTIIRKEEAGAHCMVCDKAVCLRCHDNGQCIPLLKQIELMETKGRMLKAILG